MDTFLLNNNNDDNGSRGDDADDEYENKPLPSHSFLLLLPFITTRVLRFPVLQQSFTVNSTNYRVKL